MDARNVLVTGGAGFIGSNIVETLLTRGVRFVRVVDNLVTGKMENIQFLLDKYDNIEFMYGDIADLETCRKAVRDINVITHQAALGSVPRSIINPLSSHISNVNGFLNVLIAAKEEGIKRVVYASSSSVYGDHPVLPKVEENTGNVLSPYAATKAIDEMYAGVFTRCYDMECIGLRYFNVFGPRQDPNGAYAAVIPKFIDLMKSGKPPVINGDGTFSRDFTYVENAVQANILGLTTENKECFGQVMNIGAGGRTSLLELIEVLKKELNVDIAPIFGPERPGDIPHSNADISKAREMLGYYPRIPSNEGIKKLCHYIPSKPCSINDLQYSQLLNREEINIDGLEELEYLNKKSILITGGLGSIGSEIVRQLSKFDLSVIIYDNNECDYFYLRNEMNKHSNINYILGCINDFPKLESVFSNNQIDIVYHAAAYKHVPIMEENEYESVKVNITGTRNVCDLSLKYKIDKFILVSTDKAVNPTNVMGCCKRVSEKYVNHLWHKHNTTDFITTRFGNVLGSSGSVIPAFARNINANRNLMVTHKDITRYFMTIPEAAKLVLLSSCICSENNKVLFDMGKPIRIYDLATNLLQKIGRTDLCVEISALRPGEKMYEELSYLNETRMTTKYNKIMLLSTEQNDALFERHYNDLINIPYDKCSNPQEIRALLKKLVPEYVHGE
jgi:UDP-N-acetylglucosamine 4-epimerase